MKRFLLSFVFLFLIIFSNSLNALAQNTILDFSSNLSLKEKAWFFDYDNYICKDGKLYLNAKVNSNINRTIIIHKAKMSERVQWQFSVFLPEKPNSRSKSYVLLAMLNDAKEKEREYLAIEFADIISICKIKHSKNTNSKTHNLHRIKDFYFGIGDIPNRVDSENMELENLIFDIILDKEKGLYINLYLGKKEKEYLIKSKYLKDLKFDLSRENWIGFASTYSKRLRNNFICNDFAVINMNKDQDIPSEFEDINDDNKTESNPNKDKTKETNNDFDETDGKHIVINEIMANPMADGVEFIELYNPSDKNLDLDNYFVTYTSAGNAKSMTMSLEGLSIKGKSLILLTNNINKMLEKYNYLDADICYNLSFANMSNTAFSLSLAYNNKDNVFDKVDYTKDLIPKGLKSKKGISMQRISISSNENTKNWGFSNDKNYFDTAGKINKVEVLTNNNYKNKISESIIADNQNFIDKVYKLAKESKDLELDIFIYNTAGECIYYKSGNEAINILDQIKDNSQTFYKNLYKYPYQILIFRFFFYKSKDGVQQITYKVLSSY